MVKTALLYADKVTLVSIAAALYTFYDEVIGRSLQVRAVMVRDAIAHAGPTNVVEMEIAVRIKTVVDEYLALQAKLFWTPVEFARNAQLEVQLEKELERIRGNMFDVMTTTKAGELGIAFSEGLLVIADLGAKDAADLGTIGRKSISSRYIGFVDTVLSPESTLLPVMDATSSQLARELVSKRGATSPVVRDAREAAIAAALLGDLPGIGEVPMETLLEIREKTADSRVRFREAIGAASADLEGAPWDSGFEKTLRQVYRQHVEPARLEIQASFDDRKVGNILRRLATAPGVLPAAAMIGASHALDLRVMTATALVGEAPAIVSALTAELRHKRMVRKEAEHNGLFMLFDMKRRLSKASRKRRR
jgi:hypothetical protein